MIRKMRLSGLIIIISCTIMLPACRRIPLRNDLLSENDPTQTSKVHLSPAPAQESAIPTVIPSITSTSMTATSENFQSTTGPIDRAEIFSHDFADEGEVVYNAFVTRDGRHILIMLQDNFAEIIDINFPSQFKVRLGCELFWPDVISIDLQGNSLMLCMDYSDGEEFQIWKLDKGSTEASMIASVKPDPLLTTTAAAFSPDGKYFALGFHNGEVNIYDSINGNLLRKINAHIDNVTSLAFSPDSKYLLTDSWSFDFETYAYDVQTGERIATLVKEGVGSPNEQTVWFSPDGSLAAGMSTSGLEVFTTSDWKHQYSLPSHFWGWLGCNNRTWFDASTSSQVDIFLLNNGELLMTVPTFQLFCLEDQRAAQVEILGDKVTVFAFPLE